MSKDSCARYHQTKKEKIKKSLVKGIKFLSKKKKPESKICS